jgi:Domain of unknown function (DUF4270)
MALLLFSVFLFSCQDPIGIAVDTPSTGGQVVTIFTDTVKVATSTVMLDSTVTSGQGSGIIGAYKDPILGTISAKAFAQISLPYIESTGAFAVFDFPTADVGLTVYDSAYVFITHDNFVYGDTTKSIKLSLHRLTEDLTIGRNYTKDDAVAYNPTPLASKDFTFKDLKRAFSTTQDSLLKFKMPDSFGQELYNLAGKDAATSIEKFSAAVKGLAFIANQDAQAAYGISISNCYIRIYYHTTNAPETRKTASPLTFLSTRFSQIKNNRQATPLQNLQVFQELSPSLTNNRTYTQTGAGISTKIKFPTLAVLQKDPNFTINKAELVITPDIDQITGNFKPPAQFALVELSKDNRLKKTASNVVDYLVLDAISSAQYVANYSSTNNSYTFNFTVYLQDLIKKKKTTDGIVLVPSILSETTIGINNTNVARASIKNVKLNIYYSTKK